MVAMVIFVGTGVGSFGRYQRSAIHIAVHDVPVGQTNS
jgi:hypothetical protein